MIPTTNFFKNSIAKPWHSQYTLVNFTQSFGHDKIGFGLSYELSDIMTGVAVYTNAPR